MPTLTVHGASDDLIEASGIEGADEYNAIDGGRLEVTGPNDQRFYVWCTYGNGGTWVLGVGQIDEDIPIPNWPMTLRQAETCRYSTELVIDCPEGTKVQYLGQATLNVKC